MLVSIKGLPSRFRQDSEERGVFCPESDNEASIEQIRELLSDAEYYADEFGPDCDTGLKRSAKATVIKCRNLLT